MEGGDGWKGEREEREGSDERAEGGGEERRGEGREGSEGGRGERGWTALTQSIDGSRLAAC